MNRLLKRANARLSVGKAAALLASLSFLTMFLSLFRERLLNANFGVASLDLDAYRAAFKVPDFMFIVLVSGALSVTFIPVLSQRLATGNKKSAWDMSSSLINFLSMITFVAAIGIIVFADPIVRYLIAPGMDPVGQDTAISLMRIIAVNPLLFAISSVLTSIQQALGRFFFYALAPAIYSFGIIIGILFLAPHYGIQGVAYGVVLGSFAQLLVAMIGMIGFDFKYHWGVNWRNLGFRRVLQLLPQRSFDQGIDYFNNLVEISLASRLRVGMINAWEVAFTLHWVPINMIGVAISTAAFPQMTERLNQGRPDLFKKEFLAILRVIIWLALPAVVIAYFGRGYLVRLLVAEGNTIIADLLGLLILAIFFRAIFHLVSRSFYAQQDTKTPLYVSIFAVLLNVGLAVYLVMPWGADYGIFGLAIAQSVVASVEVFILLTILAHRFPGLFDSTFFRGIFSMIGATFAMAVVTYGMIQLLPLRVSDIGFFSLVPKFAAIASVGAITYLLVSYMLGIKETRPVLERIRKIIFKPIKV